MFQFVTNCLDLLFSFAFGFLLPLFGRQDFFLLVFEYFEGAVFGLGGQRIGQTGHRTPGLELPFTVCWKQRSAALRRDLWVYVRFVMSLFGVHRYCGRPKAQLDGALHGRLGRSGPPYLFRAQGRSGKGVVGDVVHGGGSGESSPHASTGVFSSTGWHVVDVVRGNHRGRRGTSIIDVACFERLVEPKPCRARRFLPPPCRRET